MIEVISATPTTVVPPVPERRYAIYRDGLLYSMFHGTETGASNHVQCLINRHPSADWEFD